MYMITTFYKFLPIEKSQVESLREELQSRGEALHISGLILLAEEGINATIAGSQEAIDHYRTILTKQFGEMTFKDSTASEDPFKRLYVKIRNEIVAIGDPNLHPNDEHYHLTPSEWNAVLENEDVVILDTRNDYETAIGTFEGAVDPQLKEFREFPDYVASCDIPKDTKVLMYCTGGIRCEKALLEMRRQGYTNVFQLKGGILQYLKEFPQRHFRGECFVFDHRAAVDQELLPSTTYDLCPHCGDPGDQTVSCENCNAKAKVCKNCCQVQNRRTCSKNCAHHMKRKLTLTK